MIFYKKKKAGKGLRVKVMGKKIFLFELYAYLGGWISLEGKNEATDPMQ